MRGFDEFFEKATGNAPFPFQREFAVARSIPQLVNVPTGLGKTAMVAIGWLWWRFGGDEVRKAGTPKRLVYCLPMRVLVEQIAENIRQWGKTLCDAGIIDDDVPVHVLMGGENEEDWDLYPEREAILIGTQDMLLSRALNRGYATSRARWPMRFGLLNNDCFWVFDEIQLMGTGLATTAQLEAFRRKLPGADDEHAGNGHGCRSVWMSATMRRDWLRTVDFKPRVDDLLALELADDDLAHQQVRKRLEAEKPLRRAASPMRDAAAIAREVLDAHKPGTRTIVVVNTVKRACALSDELTKNRSGGKGSEVSPEPEVVLLHSRFRPGDREDRVESALAPITPEDAGTIVVSTQVIEAGVDVSSTTLFTELAPWASLVQRFGRCNRRGEDMGADVVWIDLPDAQKEREKSAPPYDLEKLEASRKLLSDLEDVGIKSLPDVELPYEHTHVIRRKDLVDLFDTTPDLAGNDIDIDRFIREVEDSAIRVFWRDWEQSKGYEPPPEDRPAPSARELCPAPVGEFRDFAKNSKRKGKVWRWNFLDNQWERADTGSIAPGQVFLIHADAGGYSAERGWNPGFHGPIAPIEPGAENNGGAPDATDDDQLSHIDIWQTIAEHSEQVSVELNGILKPLAMTDLEAEALRLAVRWHDRGKAHNVFQNAIDDGQTVERWSQTVQRRRRPGEWRGCRSIAKAPGKQKNTDGKIEDPGFWRRYDWMPGEGRKHFRHELASALAVLLSPAGLIPPEHRDLVACLVAAHHGKVRLSIHSLPNEKRPHDEGGVPLMDRRFARGVWDGDGLPETNLGGGVAAPAVTLSLEPMELGLCEEPPFAGQPSWVERMIRLRNTIGPFRLAYLEAVLRAADMRVSGKGMRA